MRTKIFNALKVSGIALFMTVGLSYVYAAVYTYTLPTLNPPQGNPAGFIDISAVSQSKAGGLQTGSLQTGTLGVGVAPSSVAGAYVSSGGAPNIGVFGANSNTYGYGIYGSADTGVYGAGAGSYGVFGTTVNPYAAGIGGSGQLYGVFGMSTQPIGTAPTGTGVFGAGGYGVTGYGQVADFFAGNRGIEFKDGSIQGTAASWKQCEGSNGKTFNESFTVPTTWTRAQCLTELQAHVSPIAWWKVGCFSTSGPTSGDWGNTSGGLPTNNSCGWDAPLPPPPPPPPGTCGPGAVWHNVCTLN